MTNREDELLANIDGLAKTNSATTTTTTVTGSNNHNNILLNAAVTADLNNLQTTITDNSTLLDSNDCRPAFLIEPNENITAFATNGHLTLLPVKNTISSTSSSSSSSSNNKQHLSLKRGVTATADDNCSILTAASLLGSNSNSNSGADGEGDGICVVGIGGDSVAGGSGNSSAATTQSSQSEFWTENPPSSASSGFSDDDSLAGQEGDPKTIEQIVQMVKTLRHQGLVKEYTEIRNKATEGTFVNAK